MTSESFIAYIMALAFSLVFLLIAALISNSIKFGTSNDKQKRKVWFWTLGVLIPVLIFGIGFFFIRTGIKVPSKQADFTMHLGIATCVGIILYILLGFIVSKIFRHKKVGHWF